MLAALLPPAARDMSQAQPWTKLQSDLSGDGDKLPVGGQESVCSLPFCRLL